MRKDAPQECKSLLARARVDLKRQQQEKDEGALKVERIGIASAYRDPWRDLAAWEKAFKKHYGKTKSQRVKLMGGEHGDKSVDFMAGKMAPIKAVPGFSNHTSGIAVDFTTTGNKEILGWVLGRRKSARMNL
ncbi:MAG: D-alanyl-D-alanine carboxypeptidase family protein [Acidobacteria bacterium]|nr:D-alanyl-D-alanine carboxypeptidase family protein [Acidobacteriota bacterium]